MHFGFSYIGLIWLCMFFIPKFLLIKNYPNDYENYTKNDNKILVLLKYIGQIMIVPTLLVFSDFNYSGFNFWTTVLIISFIFMLLYNLCIFRYLKSDKTIRDLYKSFFGLSVAFIQLPVISLFLLGIYGSNFLTILFSILLGIGHIGIGLNHKKQVYGKKAKRKPSVRIVLGVFKVIFTLLLVLVCGLFTFFIGWRNLNQIERYKSFKNGIDEQRYVKLNDQEVYVSLCGKDTNNPVVIYLHGGPGQPDTSFNYDWIKYLTNDYTLVEWNARGCGKTYYKNLSNDPENKTLTFDKHLSDLDSLVDYVCDRFDKKNVVIMGHSYGTMLGSRYSLAHPDKVSHYVAISQLVNTKNHTDRTYLYEESLKMAEEKGDDTTDMKKSYEKYISDPSVKNRLELQNHFSKYYKYPAKSSKSFLDPSYASPLVSADDYRWSLTNKNIDEWVKLEKPLIDDMFNLNYLDTNDNYSMPVLFISGSKDVQCPAEFVKQYAKSITSPKTNVEIIEETGHSPHTHYPEDVTKKIKDFLKD